MSDLDTGDDVQGTTEIPHIDGETTVDVVREYAALSANKKLCAACKKLFVVMPKINAATRENWAMYGQHHACDDAGCDHPRLSAVVRMALIEKQPVCFTCLGEYLNSQSFYGTIRVDGLVFEDETFNGVVADTDFGANLASAATSMAQAARRGVNTMRAIVVADDVHDSAVLRPMWTATWRGALLGVIGSGENTKLAMVWYNPASQTWRRLGDGEIVNPTGWLDLSNKIDPFTAMDQENDGGGVSASDLGFDVDPTARDTSNDPAWGPPLRFNPLWPPFHLDSVPLVVRGPNWDADAFTVQFGDEESLHEAIARGLSKDAVVVLWGHPSTVDKDPTRKAEIVAGLVHLGLLTSDGAITERGLEVRHVEMQQATGLTAAQLCTAQMNLIELVGKLGGTSDVVSTLDGTLPSNIAGIGLRLVESTSDAQVREVSDLHGLAPGTYTVSADSPLGRVFARLGGAGGMTVSAFEAMFGAGDNVETTDNENTVMTGSVPVTGESTSDKPQTDDAPDAVRRAYAKTQTFKSLPDITDRDGFDGLPPGFYKFNLGVLSTSLSKYSAVNADILNGWYGLAEVRRPTADVEVTGWMNEVWYHGRNRAPFQVGYAAVPESETTPDATNSDGAA